MPPNVPHIHHFIPQFLLRNFVKNGKVWVHDLETQTIISRGTKGSGSIRDLYAWELKDGSTDYHSIEEFFSRGFENHGAVAVRKLLQRGFLSNEEAMNFFAFVAAQYCRTPAFFGQMTSSMAPVLQEMCVRIAKFDSEFRDRLTLSLSESGTSSNEIDHLISTLGRGEMQVTPDRQFVMQQAFKLITKVTNVLAEMKWCFLEVPAGDRDLILGDHPVSLYNDEPFGESRPLGLGNPNVEIMLPLSNRMAACGRWEGPVSYGQFEPGSVSAANLRTIWFAQRYLYATDASENLLVEAIGERPNCPKVRVNRVQNGEKLAIITSFR